MRCTASGIILGAIAPPLSTVEGYERPFPSIQKNGGNGKRQISIMDDPLGVHVGSEGEERRDLCMFPCLPRGCGSGEAE